MVSTITVSDELRRKIKRLAALLDTTQSKIVERAIELFEREVVAKEKITKVSPKIKRILKEARKKVEEEDPDWLEVSKKIEESSIDIEEFISERWGDEL